MIHKKRKEKKTIFIELNYSPVALKFWSHEGPRRKMQIINKIQTILFVLVGWKKFRRRKRSPIISNSAWHHSIKEERARLGALGSRDSLLSFLVSLLLTAGGRWSLTAAGVL